MQSEEWVPVIIADAGLARLGSRSRGSPMFIGQMYFTIHGIIPIGA